MNMKRIDKIQKLYRDNEHNAINNFINQQKAYDNQLSILAELRNYTQQYEASFSQSASSGVSIEVIQNFNNFMCRLRSIIKKQEENVEIENSKLTVARTNWQLTKMKRAGIDQLIDQRAISDQKKSDRNEQKQLDELVLHRYQLKGE